jgi:hypothetical protein
MTRARAAALAGALTLAVVGLAGCEKPTPGVTVWSGTSSERVQAQCWAFSSGGTVDATTCLQGAAHVPSLAVGPQQTVGISVDPVVAAGGWYPTIGTQRLTASPVTSTYYRFALGESDLQQSLDLRVLALSGGQQVRGVWQVTLKRAG